MIKYRSEIDGLRALAIIPVILFHAGIPYLSGGFIGVDVFFVISGYLITHLLLIENSTDSFSLINFYNRRIRRLLPALFFMLLCITPFAWMWLLPTQLQEYSLSVIAAVTFLANMFFYLKTGYFSSEIDEKPLIHTWSLAVEEQFYIFFPIFLFLAWRLLKNHVTTLVVLLFVLSFLMAEYLSRFYPELNFYLMPTRMWELLAGSLCALYLFKRKTLPSNLLLSVAGLLLIVASYFLIDKTFRFPSYYTIPVVLGTSLIILFSQNTLVGSLLSLRSMVAIGLVSYSAYLWHQPLFALTRIKALDEPSLALMLGLGVLSLVIGAFSWKFIEQPFRKKSNKNFIISNKLTISLALIFSGLFMGVGAIGHIKKGFPERFSIPEQVSNTIQRNTDAYECFDLPFPHKEEKWGCDIGNTQKQSGYDFLVWGDSHLLVTYDAFVTAATNADKKAYYVGIRQCLPFLGIHALRNDQEERNCHQLNQRVFDFVKANKIPKIILVSRWSYYATGGYDNDNFSFVGLQSNSKKTAELSQAAYLYGLEKTIKDYNAIGTEIVFMEQVPQQKLHPEEIYALAYKNGDVDLILEKTSVSKTDHLGMQAFVRDQFDNLIANNSQISSLAMTDIFCTETCLAGSENISYYFDEDHLSIDGSKKIIKRIESVLTED